MPLDPYARRFLERLAALNPPSALSLSVAERRDALANLLRLSAEDAPQAAVEDRTIPGPAGALPVRLYTPSPAHCGDSLPGLIYFHGGGLVAGTLEDYDAISRELANASGCRVVAVAYRLAPEAPFPAAVEDACAAVAWVAAHADDFALDPQRIGVAGDSAGATLAAVASQESTAKGVPLALQVLLCPILDHGELTGSRRVYAQGYLVDSATLEHDLKHYLGSAGEVSDPRVSPAQATRLRGLPPTCIHTAEFDPLRDEGRDYAERLRAADVTTLYRCHLGMIHLFYGMGGVIPYVAAAYREIGADVRSLLSQ